MGLSAGTDFRKIVQNSRIPSVFEGTKNPPLPFLGMSDGHDGRNVGRMVGSKHTREGLQQPAGRDEIPNAAQSTRFHGHECRREQRDAGTITENSGTQGENSGELSEKTGDQSEETSRARANCEPLPWLTPRDRQETRRLRLAIGATGRPIRESDARTIRGKSVGLRAHNPCDFRLSQRFLCSGRILPHLVHWKRLRKPAICVFGLGRGIHAAQIHYVGTLGSDSEAAKRKTPVFPIWKTGNLPVLCSVRSGVNHDSPNSAPADDGQKTGRRTSGVRGGCGGSGGPASLRSRKPEIRLPPLLGAKDAKALDVAGCVGRMG